MNFLNKMERKFGRYAISGLMRYIVILDVLGTLLGIVMPSGFYMSFLSLDIGYILQGQVWRLFTFVLYPSLGSGLMSPISILFYAVELYLYFWIGNCLENAWGTFRFNLYFISGILLNILSSIILFAAFRFSFPIGLSSVNQAMFLAFAVLYPNIQLMLFFVIPIKVKWLGIFYGFMLGYSVLTDLLTGAYAFALASLVGIANFLIFFFATRNYKRISPKEQRRKAKFKKAVRMQPGVTRHKCAVCQRTEEDDENLEFRFCSKCDGNYEYCMEHLFTHEHVKKH